MKQYLNINRLRTYGGEGVLSRLFKIENQILEQTAARLSEWEKRKPAEAEMADFQEKTASWAYESLRMAFPDIKIENRAGPMWRGRSLPGQAASTRFMSRVCG